MRPTLADKKGWCLFIGTPKGKDSLYELYLKGQRGDKDWASWQFRTIDNLAVDLAEEVEEARKTTPERYFKQEYEASFEDYIGLIWPEFNEKEHIIMPFKIPAHWKIDAVIDPALSGITGVLWGTVDENGDYIIIDEYRQLDKRVSEVASFISLKDHKVNKFYIDPAAKVQKTSKEGRLFSLYDEYADHGVYATAYENDVMAGLNRVGEFLKNGRLKIFSSCTQLVWELERYHWAESRETVKGIVKAEPYKKDDHLCDCLRGFIMSRPTKSQAEQRVAPRGSVAWYEDRMEAEANNWRSKY